jgi:hypothetical protein
VIGDAAHGHAIVVHGLDSFLDDTLCIERSRPKEGRLCPKHAAARRTDVHTHDYGEHNGLIEVKVDGHPRGVPQPRRRATTTLTFDAREAPVNLAERAGCGLNECSTGLHGRGPSSGLQPGSLCLIPRRPARLPALPPHASPNVDSAVSKSAFDITEMRSSDASVPNVGRALAASRLASADASHDTPDGDEFRFYPCPRMRCLRSVIVFRSGITGAAAKPKCTRWATCRADRGAAGLEYRASTASATLAQALRSGEPVSRVPIRIGRIVRPPADIALST